MNRRDFRMETVEEGTSEEEGNARGIIRRCFGGGNIGRRTLKKKKPQRRKLPKEQRKNPYQGPSLRQCQKPAQLFRGRPDY